MVVYGPCRQPARDIFVNWLYNLVIDEEDLWLLIGDFNFYRSDMNRYIPGSNFNDSLVFNNIQIGIRIPKTNIFRFENYWFNHPRCMEHIVNVWNTSVRSRNSGHAINEKLKLLRRVLKRWAKNLSNLSLLISNCNLTIAFFDKLEEIRDLLPHEAIFRKFIKSHILNQLAMQNEYWRQRYTQTVV